MEQMLHTFNADTPVAKCAPLGAASALILCEHACNAIPDGLHNLGISEEVRHSHVAWDPGALGVAKALVEPLSAQLIYSTVSRLAYDCNRPPHAPSAIPARSEIYDIPGNASLSAAQRRERADKIYHPFRQTVEAALTETSMAYLVTIHSFTPIYHGAQRDVEIGILHGEDIRLAEAMMNDVPSASPYVTRLNEPYCARDGVAHSLDHYGGLFDVPTVMIEIRNDLITTHDEQQSVAALLAPWISAAAAKITAARGDV